MKLTEKEILEEIKELKEKIKKEFSYYLVT